MLHLAWQLEEPCEGATPMQPHGRRARWCASKRDSRQLAGTCELAVFSSLYEALALKETAPLPFNPPPKPWCGGAEACCV